MSMPLIDFDAEEAGESGKKPGPAKDVLVEYRDLEAIDDDRRRRWASLTEAEKDALRAFVARANVRPEALLSKHWKAFIFRFALVLMDLPAADLAAILGQELAGSPGPGEKPEVRVVFPEDDESPVLTAGQREFLDGLPIDYRSRFEVLPDGRRSMILRWFTVDVQPPLLQEALRLLQPNGLAILGPSEPEPEPPVSRIGWRRKKRSAGRP